MKINEILNHDRFVKAFKNRSGMEFHTFQIKEIMLKETDIKLGGIRPNDHAIGNKCPCSCAGTEKGIFDRIEIGLYSVR